MNNKNRKLQFIRVKNNLRRGRTSFIMSEKVSSKIAINPEQLGLISKESKKQIVHQLYKIYKIKHSLYVNKAISFRLSTINDDFSKGIQTLVCTLNLTGAK